ncbi:MAG: CHASE2 domain-containing protein, partial [Phycisphaeraceae bacterium JB051]
MTPPERKLFIRNMLLGLVISLSMVVANRMGWIQSLERWFYDVRAKTCQYQQTPPTDQLVHLDIDDSTLQAIGAWPWDRQVLAQVIDELTLANAKVVGLDVVFPEPQKPRYALDDNGMVEGELIRDDRLLADSLDQSHHSLLSVAVEIPVADESKALIQKTATDLIDGDLTLSRDAFEKELKTRPIFKQVKQLAVNVDSLFIRTRKQVLYQRSVALLKDNPQAGFYDARQTILPHLDVELIGGSPLINTLEKEFDRARSMQAIHRYTTPLSNVQQPPVTVEAQLPPISLLSQAGMGAGFVTYLPDSDGVVRSVPMAVYDGQKVIPQLGLMLACAYLGVAPRDLHFTENGVQIPKPDGKVINLPLRQEQVESVNRQVRYLYDVPWFGPVDNWQYMYDPQQMQTRQHLPVIAVYRITSYQQEIATNNQQIDKAISIVLDDDADYKLKLNPDLGKSYREQRPPVTNWQARKAMVAKLKADDFVSAVYQDFVKLKDEDLNETDRFFKSELIKAYRAMDEALTRNEQWEKQIVDARTQLKQAVSGKAVLIGWTGTATIADFVQTSLHHKCPGVVVHGAIFNAILTDSSWIRSPAAVDVAIIIILGLIATVLVARLSPVLALIGCVSIAGLYFAINGLVLFDRMSLLVTAASPLMTVGMVWSGCTLNRFIIERTDRARITRQFSNYVDPALVDYVITNP